MLSGVPPHRLGRNRRGLGGVLRHKNGGESENELAPAGSQKIGASLSKKRRRVEPWNGSWTTAPNHSRPVYGAREADIDAEDPPERDPRQGHGVLHVVMMVMVMPLRRRPRSR
jgi:hypothetical protein